MELFRSSRERIRYLKSLHPELESSLGPKCDLNLPYICDNCLHRIGEGGFGTVVSTMWSWGIKSSLEEEDKDYKTRKKLGIAQIICAELEKIHAKGWVHVEAKDKVYGIISYIASEIIRGHPYSQAGDIYSLGILLWELACGIIAFADRSHDVNLILDICDGLRSQTCHYSPLVYNDIIKMCWDPDPSKRPSASEILISIERLCEFRRSKDDLEYPKSGDQIEHGDNYFKFPKFFDSNGYGLIKYFESKICQQLINAHRACRIYIKMKWKPNKPIHSEAVYTSRSFSYKSLQDEIDILLSQK
ncbi:kinase-like domain-containing protein [Rhizophagus diaphanus]|nr:kinase-like domain-containing protein [Rhizophagus diaphanus] [Rhizophagus sp. MUCL 43196]